MLAVRIEKVKQLFSALTGEEQERWLRLLEEARRKDAVNTAPGDPPVQNHPAHPDLPQR